MTGESCPFATPSLRSGTVGVIPWRSNRKTVVFCCLADDRGQMTEVCKLLSVAGFIKYLTTAVRPYSDSEQCKISPKIRIINKATLIFTKLEEGLRN